MFLSALVGQPWVDKGLQGEGAIEERVAPCLTLLQPPPQERQGGHARCLWATSAAFPYSAETMPSGVIYMAKTIFLTLLSQSSLKFFSICLGFLYDRLQCIDEWLSLGSC